MCPHTHEQNERLINNWNRSLCNKCPHWIMWQCRPQCSWTDTDIELSIQIYRLSVTETSWFSLMNSKQHESPDVLWMRTERKSASTFFFRRNMRRKHQVYNCGWDHCRILSVTLKQDFISVNKAQVYCNHVRDIIPTSRRTWWVSDEGLHTVQNSLCHEISHLRHQGNHYELHSDSVNLVSLVNLSSTFYWYFWKSDPLKPPSQCFSFIFKWAEKWQDDSL